LEPHASVQQFIEGARVSDTYRFTRRGFPGVFTVEANSMEHARNLAESFFKAVLSDVTWSKIIQVESCVGCEDIPEPSEEEVERMLSANDKH
jgi:hypothetical protein